MLAQLHTANGIVSGRIPSSESQWLRREAALAAEERRRARRQARKARR